MTDLAMTLDPRPMGPAPMHSGATMAHAIDGYLELQGALDRKMPDQIMAIGDRRFRRKGYWRAVAVAFNLEVALVEERRDDNAVTADGEADWGYLVTYRASTLGGRAMTGDGACYASEKAARQRTVHNVRAHAHTRAKNRAIADLVAFGEVSAEEVDDDAGPPSAPRRPVPPRPAAKPSTVISEAQDKRLWAIASTAGWGEPAVRELLGRYGFEQSRDVTRDAYEGICRELQDRPIAR